MTGKRRREQKRITDLARGKPCQIRLVGICNRNDETTAPCHFRMPCFGGIGFIPGPLFVAWGCSNCHAWVDSHHDAETQLAFAHGVLRTQAELIAEGIIQW